MLSATEINELYLSRMKSAESQSDGKTLAKIRDFWWPSFIESYNDNPTFSLNNLDVFMDSGRKKMDAAAHEFAESKGFLAGSPDYVQRITQFMKSNTGKMFERFVGLALSHHLLQTGSAYCVWGFSNELSKFSELLSPSEFNVSIKQGNSTFNINIDADLLIFNPVVPDDFVYMVSIKSTLKDRFHNVPFWNLLRVLSLSDDTDLSKRVVAANSVRLAACKYVAICSDLAKEQPDFAGESPRNLLSFDAALLDAAYVSSSKAAKLKSSANHFGFGRDYPFSPLSNFFSALNPTV